ncbi:MAG: ABC transporter ATP-binding protein [Sporomusaceae bacterium]|nr:ABC transporter ATP-binding protein [Sporomusaceae bacterium]
MTHTDQTALQVSQVAIAIGEKEIVRACSFQAERGEFIGVIGPNGAGKSTLLKGLRGLLPLRGGEVTVFGRPLSLLSAKQAARLIAYMQQEVNVGFGFTALQIVLAGRYPHLEWWRNESSADKAIALKYMDFTGVVALAGKAVTEVSGGERQRILLAKALAQETPLLFLDEPTASLDLVYQEEIFRYCRSVCQTGKTVLLIAHDIRMAAKFCSRLLLLAGGRIIADGQPAAVITRENLARAYGLHSAVFVNSVTGNLDLHTYEEPAQPATRRHVHLIGGGGVCGAVMRRLYELGCRLSAGVLQAGDTDAAAADAFGAKYVAAPAFSAVTTEQAEQHRRLIAASDLVVLGNLCFSRQNLDNLRAAFDAGKLVVLEDSPIDGRDFSGGEASRLYRELLERQPALMTTAQFLERAAALLA